MQHRVATGDIVGKLLDLAYNPEIPKVALATMERWGRRLGLPLATLELLGQDEGTCGAFCRAASRGRAQGFLDVLEVVRLERLRASRAPPAPEALARAP